MQQQGSARQNSVVVDLSAYRSAKRGEPSVRELRAEDEAQRNAIDEIAHYLLMAARVIKNLHP